MVSIKGPKGWGNSKKIAKYVGLCRNQDIDLVFNSKGTLVAVTQ